MLSKQIQQMEEQMTAPIARQITELPQLQEYLHRVLTITNAYLAKWSSLNGRPLPTYVTSGTSGWLTFAFQTDLYVVKIRVETKENHTRDGYYTSEKWTIECSKADGSYSGYCVVVSHPDNQVWSRNGGGLILLREKLHQLIGSQPLKCGDAAFLDRLFS